MVSITYSNLDAKGILDAVRRKKFGRYVLLYLYNSRDEANALSQRLLGSYGYLLNNAVGGDFVILTAYDKGWLTDSYMGKKDIQRIHREMRYFDVSRSPRSFEDYNFVMEDLAEAYGIHRNRLPALVVVDTDGWNDGKEAYFTVEFGQEKSPKEICAEITGVVTRMRSQYGNFAAIAESGRTLVTETNETLLNKRNQRVYLYTALMDYIRSSPRKFIKKTAEAVGINERTLRRYMAEQEPLPRETAIALALALEMSPAAADALFDVARKYPLRRLEASDPRENLICACLVERKGLEDTNRILKLNRFAEIKVKTRTQK